MSCEGRLVCDDFEKAAVGGKPAAPFVVRAGKDTVTVDETRAYSGKRSVKVAITATASGDTYRQAMLAVTGAPLIPLSNNRVYGRFMIYTDRVPDKTVHWTIAHGDAATSRIMPVCTAGANAARPRPSISPVISFPRIVTAERPSAPSTYVPCQRSMTR